MRDVFRDVFNLSVAHAHPFSRAIVAVWNEEMRGDSRDVVIGRNVAPAPDPLLYGLRVNEML